MSIRTFPKLIVYLVLICLLAACTVTPQTTPLEAPPMPSVPTLIPSESLPSYIHTLWPGPDETVSQATLMEGMAAPYRGIGLGIFGTGVGIPLNEKGEYLIPRSTLFINGEAVANDSFLHADGLQIADLTDREGNSLGKQFVGPLYLSWTPLLPLGTHTAKYVLIMENARFEYEWSFTVVE